jgi:hypothetical protein
MYVVTNKGEPVEIREVRARSFVAEIEEWPRVRVHACGLVPPVSDFGIEGVMAA